MNMTNILTYLSYICFTFIVWQTGMQVASVTLSSDAKVTGGVSGVSVIVIQLGGSVSEELRFDGGDDEAQPWLDAFIAAGWPMDGQQVRTKT